MTQIQLNDRSYNMEYNQLTAIGFEKMTGKPAYDLQQFSTGMTEPILTLGYCMLLANNPDVPDFEDFLRLLNTPQAAERFITATGEELNRYYNLGKLPAQSTRKGKASKNV